MQQNNDCEHNAFNAKKHQSIKQNDVYKPRMTTSAPKKKKGFEKFVRKSKSEKKMGRKNMKKTKSEGNGLTKKMKKILL
jgi:hypothetical protein